MQCLSIAAAFLFVLVQDDSGGMCIILHDVTKKAHQQVKRLASLLVMHIDVSSLNVCKFLINANFKK